MKIIIINAIYGSKSTGTIVRQLQEHCLKNNVNTYVAYSIADRKNNKIPNGYKIGNYITARWQAILSRISGKQGYYNRLTTWLFILYLKQIKPDVVHLHNLHSNFINLNMLLKYLSNNNIPIIITMHDCWYFTGGCFHYTSVNCKKWQENCGNCPKRYSDTPAYLFDSSSKILQDRKKYLNSISKLIMIGCSKWIADECRNSVLSNIDIRYIYNGFDFNIFKQTESNLREELDAIDKYIILAPANKWFLPINKDTLEYFLKNCPSDTILVFYGCKQNSLLHNNVRCIGYIRNAVEMAKLYSTADIMVNCSREDTLSSINIECQSCGTPVITYDDTGNKETVDGICGKAIKTGDYKLLFNTVIEFKNIGKSRLSELCINWTHKNFKLEDSLNKYLELYKEISKE